jgi:hypothetical protein
MTDMAHRSDREILLATHRKVEELMTTEQLTTLTTDLEADATAAQAEFTKRCWQGQPSLAEGKVTPESLEPLKSLVEGLDTKVKAAASEIPTT